MDLEKISTLSDDQLIALYRNPAIATEVKKNVLAEIKQRDLESSNDFRITETTTFEAKDKMHIFFFAPILIASVLFFILFHHFYLRNWNKTKYQTFWKYTTLGVGFYTLLLFAWLHFRNS